MRVMYIINDLPGMRPPHGQANNNTFNPVLADCFLIAALSTLCSTTFVIIVHSPGTRGADLQWILRVDCPIAGVGDSVHSSSPSTPSPLSNASSVNSRSLFFRMALSGKCNV